MKRDSPIALDISSDDEAEGSSCKKPKHNGEDHKLPPKITHEGTIIRRAQMYQEYMKQLPLPTNRPAVIPCTTWQGLAKSMKQIYGQPLHCLTDICLEKWDQLRTGAEDEHQRLDTTVHPAKAEITIWCMEEVHRLTTSHEYLSKLWLADPLHNLN